MKGVTKRKERNLKRVFEKVGKRKERKTAEKVERKKKNGLKHGEEVMKGNFHHKEIMKSTSLFSQEGKINWFPGHMVKAQKLITQKLKQADVVMEVRDARAPFSSSNPFLQRQIQEASSFKQLKRLIIFNKADLSNPNLHSVTLFFKIKLYFFKL